MKLPKINVWRCLQISAMVVLMLPFVSLVLPNGATPERQRKLDRIVRHIERLEVACREPKLEAVLRHTAYRYRSVGMFGIRTQPLRWGDGVNIPWCPGFVLDARAWDYPDDILLMLIVHEAHHDFYPYLGHYQYWGTIPCSYYNQLTDLEILVGDVR